MQRVGHDNAMLAGQGLGMLHFLGILIGLAGVWPAAAATVGETDRFIPLAHDGGGWTTELTIVNLSNKPAQVQAIFSTAKGYAEPWKLELRASKGRVRDSSVEASLEVGAALVVETGGTAAELTRGYVEIVEFHEQPVGAAARLVRRREGVIVQSIVVPLSPAHESRSVVPLRMAEGGPAVELVLVSPTSWTMLDIRFRDLEGVEVWSDRMQFQGVSQMIVDVGEAWPQLRTFRGTMEWVVSFPGADRYEERFLSSLILERSGGQWWAAKPSMTMPGDQRKTSPY